MMYSNGNWSFIGFALLFVGIGILLSIILAWGWFMIVVAIMLIVIGTYLASF